MGRLQIPILKLREIWFYLTNCQSACFEKERNIKCNDTIYQLWGEGLTNHFGPLLLASYLFIHFDSQKNRMLTAVEGFLSDRILVPAVGLFDGTAEKNPKRRVLPVNNFVAKAFF